METYKPFVVLFYSHNFIDYDAFDQVFKTGTRADIIGNLWIDGVIITSMPLVIYDVSI